MEDQTQDILKISQDLLSFLSVADDTTVEVSFNSEENTYSIAIQTQNPSLLIGYHGENLAAMQNIISQHVFAKQSSWPTLTINVNDYREKRLTAVTALADSAVSRVIATGQAHSLPPMPANERRLVHMHLQDHPQVTTASEGIGRSRGIIISPKPETVSS
ncbi:MAG: R3H domain-containing nucleic acid-binding protein [Patescibacteria group bacterium]